LRGLIRCEVCGFACAGRTTTSNGKKYSYYGCVSHRTDRGAGSVRPHRAPNVSAPWLEALVWQDVRQFLEDPGETLRRVREQRASGAADATGELEARHADLGRRLAAKQAEKDRYVKLYAQGHISKQELETYLLDLKNQIGNLRLLVEAAEADLSQKQDDALAARNTEAWLLTLGKRLAEVEENTDEAFEKRRTLVKLLVERIDVGRGEDGRTRVRTTYRFGPPGESAEQEESDFAAGVQNSCGNLAAKRKPSGATSRQRWTVDRRGVP
ncbi:MAG TPA: recombinase zinc beta ribbon domain-containing protein, partial [Rubrobacter sp.]|nr:recombinase zinc beta ribbon domain-containing protein [Rubrobacter sp.]